MTVIDETPLASPQSLSTPATSPVTLFIKIFVNQAQAKTIDVPLDPADKILIVCALSGG